MTEPPSFRYASFGKRLFACLVDSLIAFVMLIIVAVIIRTLLAEGILHRPANPPAWEELGIPEKIAALIAYFASLGALYIPFCHASPAQATVGKRMAKIYLASADGSPLNFSRAFGRWFAQTLLGMFGVGLVSILTILTDPKRRAIHDHALGTIVVAGIPPGWPPLPWGRVAASIGVQAVYLIVGFSFILGLVQF